MITEITMMGKTKDQLVYVYHRDKYGRVWYFDPYFGTESFDDPYHPSQWVLSCPCFCIEMSGWEDKKPSDKVIERYNTHFKDHPNTCTCCKDLI